jgi:phosphinothricin acetyltransferase
MPGTLIRPAVLADLPGLTEIYNHYVIHTPVTFNSQALGKGIGSLLYGALFEALREEDIHRFVAGYTLPNPASAALHARFGFKAVGIFPEVGRKFGCYWEVAWSERPAHAN